MIKIINLTLYFQTMEEYFIQNGYQVWYQLTVLHFSLLKGHVALLCQYIDKLRSQHMMAQLKGDERAIITGYAHTIDFFPF